jgi:hypothetical protein
MSNGSSEGRKRGEAEDRRQKTEDRMKTGRAEQWQT